MQSAVNRVPDAGEGKVERSQPNWHRSDWSDSTVDAAWTKGPSNEKEAFSLGHPEIKCHLSKIRRYPTSRCSRIGRLWGKLLNPPSLIPILVMFCRLVVKGTDDLGLDGFAPGEHHLSIVKVPEVSWTDLSWRVSALPFIPSSFIPNPNLSFLWLGYDLSSLRNSIPSFVLCEH